MFIIATLSDYKDWLEELDFESSDYEAISQLVHSIRNRCECGLYNTQEAKGVNNGWIISASGVEDKLHLKTPKQMTALVRHIEYTLCEDTDAEIYAWYKHALERD